MRSTDNPIENIVDVEVDFAKMKDNIMSFPPKTILVRIQDVWLTRADLECLLHDGKWLDGEVS